MEKCRTCDGCGKIASDGDKTPWKYWQMVNDGNATAVLCGLVKPLECPDCNGKGEVKTVKKIADFMQEATKFAIPITPEQARKLLPPEIIKVVMPVKQYQDLKLPDISKPIEVYWSDGVREEVDFPTFFASERIQNFIKSKIETKEWKIVL